MGGKGRGGSATQQRKRQEQCGRNPIPILFGFTGVGRLDGQPPSTWRGVPILSLPPSPQASVYTLHFVGAHPFFLVPA